MNKRTGKHEFAFYVHDLPIKPCTEFTLNDEELVHHIRTVLRLTPGDICIVFSKHHCASATIVNFEKRAIVVSTTKIKENKELTPDIVVILPLLKRDALKQAVYNAAACGANTIVPVITEKSRSDLSGHELERLEKMVIAAAQQSKQFAFPDILFKDTLTSRLDSITGYTFVHCDPSGQKLQDTIDQLKTSNAKKIALLVGPEGDFTEQEKNMIKEHAALVTQLTPTVLRAEDAVLVALGAIRSLL